MKNRKSEPRIDKLNRSKNRSSSRRKGKVPTETTTYNHPRKDYHSPSK